MANVKKISVGFTESGITSYAIIRREIDKYLLNDATGTFDSTNPSDHYITLTEDSITKGLYEVEESRSAWNNGSYYAIAYKQDSTSPIPASDEVIGQGNLYIRNDLEIQLNDDVNLIKERTDENAFQDGAVWIDTIDGSSGTTYPLGTSLNPVDNFTDALSIAQTNNIDKFIVAGSITIGASDDISNMMFIEGAHHSTMVLTNGCTTLNTTFKGHIHISGYFDGHVHCEDCHFTSLTFNMEGFFISCLLDSGFYYLEAGQTSIFSNCKTADILLVVIDCGATGDLVLRNYSGYLQITNINNTGVFYDLSFLNGRLVLNSSVVAGIIWVSGIVSVTDNSAGATVSLTDTVIPAIIDTVLSGTHGAGSWDTDNIDSKLPTNYIMGSSDQTDKDDEIDAIKAKTDNLPVDPASETNVDATETKVDELLSRLTALRAGYLDNLSAGAVALQSTLTSVQSAIAALNDVSAIEIDTQLSSTHGAGSWLSGDIGNVELDDTDANKQVIAKALKDQDISAISEITGSVYKALNDALTIIKTIETGRWKILNNQMIFYDTDNTTPLYTFDLKDSSGNPTENNPVERIPE